LDVIYNDQPFRSNVDFLNTVDPTFPGIQNAGTQNSDRRSLSVGLRSNFGTNVVNQFRYAQLAGWLRGNSRFDLVGGTEFWDTTQNGFDVVFGAGLTRLTIRNAFSARSSPTRDFTDNVSWVTGNHTFTIGGQVKKIETISDSVSPVRTQISLGVVTAGPATDTGVLGAFTTTTLPGANATELANAQALYATLTGRISATTSTVYLEADGVYRLNGNRHFEIEENTNGLFGQDSWRMRPNFTLSYGVRWQPQLGAKLNTTNYALLNDFNMIYDVSGPGNLFSPGTLTGTVPTVRSNTLGERAFRNDLKNFAPSVGAVWSPEFGSGFLSKIFGDSGKSVFRGGFSRAFIREGTLTVENSVGLNPGGTFSNNRSGTLGNIAIGTLFRTPGNPNLTPPAFNSTPVYPRTLTAADAAFAFSPDFRSGYVDSWSFGYQRELGRDTVVELRYLGNRGKDMQIQYNLNEINAIENGFGAEFALAQQNLLANINAGRGANFRYFGAGTGTSPLPIILSYIGGNAVDPNAAASYGSVNFASTVLLGQLNPANPAVLSMANTLDGNFRANSRVPGAFRPNGLPVNFVHNCPTTLGFCFLFDNSEKSWYDAAVVEVRRRMSAGLRFQASHTYGKSFTNAYAAPTGLSSAVGTNDQSNVGAITLRRRNLDKTFSQIDIRHAFKFDATWDLPFGKGRQFLSSSNWLTDTVFGGWTLSPTVRWQSGAPILMSDIQVVGMTGKELQKAVGVYYNQVVNGSVVPVSYLPTDIIENTIRAFTLASPVAAVGTTPANTTGYPVGSAPTGRFIAPAGYGNCQQRAIGTCGYRKFVLYGPNFFKVDSSIGKRINIGEKRNVELRMTVFDVLNHTNWRLGGWTGNVNNITTFTGTFGQMATGWSYQDPNGSNDPGGRILDFLLRINF
jgi:hypothetical protein